MKKLLKRSVKAESAGMHGSEGWLAPQAGHRPPVKGTFETRVPAGSDIGGVDKTAFGFWVYLMTDCMVFASLFATYAVLQNNTFGGPGASELFSLPFVLTETLLLLTSSFTCGLGIVALRRGDMRQVIILFIVTYLLGLSFLGMELFEFRNLALEGNSWTRSGFLSAFFTLVGTHGLHIATGLLWMVVLLAQMLRKGLTAAIVKRLTLFSMFWHFLDIIWICIFTLVYLMGAA